MPAPFTEEPTLRPVGVAHTPYATPDDAPHQGFAAEAESTIEIFDPFRPALNGLEDVTRLTVVYWAHLANRDQFQSVDGDGAFARRGPSRPNPISLCTGLLLDFSDSEILVTGLDAVDGSPVMDLKPALQRER